MNKQSLFTILLIVLMSMTGVKVYAYIVRDYDIVVANADGVMIYYGWINNNSELTVCYAGDYLADSEFGNYSNAYSGNINIPEYVEYKGKTYRLTSIEGSAFYQSSGLLSVTIPNSVTSIGSFAFSGCSGLPSITIPNSVTSIGSDAFYGTVWYDNQPNGLVYAGKVAYKYKGIMPANTHITIKDGTLGIAGSAFSGCSNLTSITIPNSVTSIGDYAFQNCSGLSSITIPNSVISIGMSTFYGCSDLTSITIPNSVTSIGNYAFKGTDWYNNQPDGVLYAGKVAYEYKGNMPANTQIAIKDGTLVINQSAFSGCSGLTSVTIPNSVISIGYNAFQNCSGLTSVTIPNSVISIGNCAFRMCTGLTSVTIPNSVTSIGQDAFSGCSGLTSIVSEIESPFAIYNTVFSNIPSYSQLVVPRGKKSVYQSTEGWNQFTNIVEVGGVGYIFEADGIYYKIGENNTVSVTYGNTKYSGDVVIPSQVVYEGKTYSVTSIGSEAFYDCSGLTSVTIPNSVKSINDDAFSYCSGLTSIIIPESVGYMGWRAFRGCNNLLSITFLGSLFIDKEAFTDCHPTAVHITDLESFLKIEYEENYDSNNPLDGSKSHLYLNGVEIKDLVIPNTITSINAFAFHGFKGLNSITIPNSVTSIGPYAFAASGLNAICSLNREPPMCNYSFGGIKEKCVVWVPKGSMTAYKDANEWKDFQNIKEILDGDVNLDGKVTMADVVAVVAYIMDEAPEGFYESLADLNGDEKVNVADLVMLIDVMNSYGLSTESQMSFQRVDGNLVVSGATCTLINDRTEAIQLTRCELYCDEDLVGYKNFTGSAGTVSAGGNKSCSFDNLASLASSTGFSVRWHYTANGETFVYRYPLTD